MKYIAQISFVISILSFTMLDSAVAQIAEDALRLSPTGPIGTARIQAMGGTGFSLGGDPTSAALNPAGLGFFDRSELVITPTFNGLSTDASFVDQSRESIDNNFGITNFAVVFNSNSKNITSDWRGGAFGISYNRIDRYNFEYDAQPVLNEQFSLLNDFATLAGGIDVNILEDNISDDFYTDYATAAYRNFLINPVDPDNPNTSYVPSIPGDVVADQDGTVTESSRLSQWNFSYGGSFKDKFYVGAGLGIKSFSFERTNTFNEFYVYPDEYIAFIDEGNFFFPVEGGPVSVDYVNSNQLTERQRIDATGINGMLGAIYRPVQEVTIGLSYQTPTAFAVTEDYNYRLASDVRGVIFDEAEGAIDIAGDDGVVNGTPLALDYTLTTPSRLGAGISYFVQQYGFISADVEYINYEKHRYRSNTLAPSLEDALNQVIENDFRSVVNYRVGGEFRYEIFRARAGYALRKSPLDIPSDGMDRDQIALSGGIGVRLPKFFADLAVVSTRYESNYRPYTYANFYPADQFQQDNRVLNVMLTLGFNL